MTPSVLAHAEHHGTSTSIGAAHLLAWAPALLAALALLGYVVGVVRLGRRGDAWPVGRTAAVIAGCGAAAVVTAPGLGGGFTAHVGQHLVLAMLVPLLLARSAPVTLALRLLRPRARRRVLRVLHSRPARTLTRPLTVVVLDVGSLAALYLTPLYALAERSAPVHAAVHGHMVATGCLLAWWLVGLDPMPRRAGTRSRVAVMAVTAVAHDVLAKHLYATAPAALGSPADVRRGAELLFYGGEAVEVLLAVALMADWYARGGRALARQRSRTRPAGQGMTTSIAP